MIERTKVTELLFRAVDEELDPQESMLLREQIESCADCAREAVYVRAVVQVVRQRCVRVSAPMSLRLRILNQFDHRRGEQ